MPCGASAAFGVRTPSRLSLPGARGIQGSRRCFAQAMHATLRIRAQRIWAARATDGLSFDARIMRTPNPAAAPDDPRTQDQRDITRCRVECDRVVQGADGCTMVTGASDSIGPMTPQPLRFMCSGAVLPLQCFTLGVPTARLPADLCPALLYNAVVPCWRTFAQRTHGHVASALGATRLSCRPGTAAQKCPQNSDEGC